MAEPTIFLATTFDAEGKEAERLVSAESRSAAVHHCVRINKASASDVARCMAGGASVEEAKA